MKNFRRKGPYRTKRAPKLPDDDLSFQVVRKVFDGKELSNDEASQFADVFETWFGRPIEDFEKELPAYDEKNRNYRWWRDVNSVVTVIGAVATIIGAVTALFGATVIGNVAKVVGAVTTIVGVVAPYR